MIATGILEFVRRDWASVRANKDAYWAERISRLGPGEALRVADSLRQQALLQHPSWPDASSRREDLNAMPGGPDSCAVSIQPAAVELLTALAPVLARWYLPRRL